MRCFSIPSRHMCQMSGAIQVLLLRTAGGEDPKVILSVPVIVMMKSLPSLMCCSQLRLCDTLVSKAELRHRNPQTGEASD